VHELSIALNIIDGVLGEAQQRGIAEVQAVHLRVGRLSGVDKDALLFSYRVASEDTPLVNSNLLIEDVDVVIHCPACRAERSIQSFPSLLCADCGTAADRVIRGQELEITSFEVAA
jgi:hydrogenase nickel incorporation protein HypA/HybF